MQINPNIVGVPAAQLPGFTAAVNAACNFYDQLFSNNVTLNITFTYAAPSGSTPPNAIATNVAQGIYVNYGTVKTELTDNATTQVAQTAVGTLPNSSPVNSSAAFFVTEAQAKAWGLGSLLPVWPSYPVSVDPSVAPLLPSLSPFGSTEYVFGAPQVASVPDATVTLFNGVNWDFTQSGSGGYDAVGVLEHEISESMGRIGIDGSTNLFYNQNGNTYSALDLFRYTPNASGGLTQTLTPGPGSFSIDGQNLLQSYNDPTATVPLGNGQTGPAGGDLADWNPNLPGTPSPTAPGGYDAYGSAPINGIGLVSGVDIEEMNAIGWQIVNPTVAQLQSLYAANPTSMELSVVDSAANVSSNFDALKTLAQNSAFNSISFTDLVPVLSLTASQVTSDASLFPLIQGQSELSVNLSGAPVTFTLPGNIPYITLTGSGDATITGNALNDTYIVNAQGNHTIDPGNLGDDNIVSNAGTTTLDYTSVGAGLTVDVPDGQVLKPGGIWVDTFNSGVQDFIGSGAGSTTFEGAGTGGDTFTGKGNNNTVDYSADTDGVTIDLANDTVTKDLIFPGPYAPSPLRYQDTFSDIQTFIGGGSGNTTFESVATGAYTFTGQGAGNTLDYSQDTDGVTIDLTTDTVRKDIAGIKPVIWWQDSFSDIQTFVGGGSGNTTFKGIGLGDYTFTGQGTNNTLDYSNDQRGITINLATDTVTKYNVPNAQPYTWQDDFSGIQTIDGSAGNDTLLDGAGAGVSFVGSGSNNTAVFNGQRSEYTIALSTDSGGVQHVTVTDIGTTGDATLDLVDVQSLQFAGGTAVATSGLSSAPPVVTPVSSNISASHGQSFAASSLFTANDPDGNPFTQYVFQDTGSGGGHFVLNGVAQSANQAITVTAAQLSQLIYQSGSGADTLKVKAYDGVQWSAWSSAFTVTAPVDSGPTESVSNLTAPNGQYLAGSSLFTCSYPFGSPAIQ